MAKISKIEIAHIGEAAPAAGMSAEGLSLRGEGRTSALFDREQDPIRLRIHDMAPGSTLSWQPGDAGHLIYVWSGAVDVAGGRVAQGETFIIEHSARCEATGVGAATRLVEFTQNLRVGTRPAKPGGKVHALARADALRCDDYAGDGGSIRITVHADARCPGCDLWLHESTLSASGFEAALHSHNESEVILITGGEIFLGRRNFRAGTAIAIARNTVYGFRAGQEGVSFVNFRPASPTYVMAGSSEVVDEWEDLVCRIR